MYKRLQDQSFLYSESQIYDYIARVFIMSYYLFKIKCRGENEFNINISIACIFISGLLIYLELKMKRIFYIIIKKLMTVYVFIYLGFTVLKAKIKLAQQILKCFVFVFENIFNFFLKKIV